MGLRIPGSRTRWILRVLRENDFIWSLFKNVYGPQRMADTKIVKETFFSFFCFIFWLCPVRTALYISVCKFDTGLKLFNAPLRIWFCLFMVRVEILIASTREISDQKIRIVFDVLWQLKLYVFLIHHFKCWISSHCGYYNMIGM